MTTTIGADTAVRATYIAFIGSGLAFSTWASRIPQVRDALELTPSRLGLVLLAIAIGSIVALLLSGHIVARFGSRATVVTMAALLTAAMGTVSVGYHFGVTGVVAGLFVFGFVNGAWDVAMNVQGAIVERRLGYSIMSRFHAGYSVGTVAGALIGVGAIALRVPVAVHLTVMAALITVVVVVGVRGFLPDTDPGAEAEAGGGSVLAVWREPRTLLIGLFVLCMAFAEGSGLDWISVAVIDDYAAPAAIGTLGFAVYLAAMTAGRWFGPALLDRFGRVAMVRTLAGVALAGVLVFVLGDNLAVAFAGALLWGIGVSLGFPVGMSAAADEPVRAAPRVSVVASLGYCAFLGGPPLIGFLGDHLTVQKGLIAVVVVLGIAALAAGVTRPLPGAAIKS